MALTQVDQGLLGTYAQYTGFKNRLINGQMAIDQRNAGAAVSTASTGVYTVDRWATISGGAAASFQRVAGSTYQYAMQITGAASNSQVGIFQRIEAANIWDLAGQTAILSFTVSSSTLTSLGVQFGYPSASDNWTSATTFGYTGLTISSTPTRVSVLVSVPSGATNGLSVQIGTGALTSGTLTITGVQLEKGSTATSFDYRPYGTELALCQRYYEKSYNTDVAPGTASTTYSEWSSSGSAGGLTTAYLDGHVPFKVTKRATPTLAAWDEANGSGTCTRISPGILATSGQALGFASAGMNSVVSTSSNGTSAGRFTFNWTASAEL
jgi:hypothetical protein